MCPSSLDREEHVVCRYGVFRCARWLKRRPKRENRALGEVSQNSAVRVKPRSTFIPGEFESGRHHQTARTPTGVQELRYSLEGGGLSRSLRYGYLVTTSPRRSHLRRLPPLRVRTPASGVTGFRAVMVAWYKARERIHRGVADPRDHATPPSWKRVSVLNRTGTGFLGFAPPHGFAALCTGQCSTCVARARRDY